MRFLRCAYLLIANSLLFLFPVAFYAQTNINLSRVIALGVRDQWGQFVDGIQGDQIVVKGSFASIKRFELDNAPRRILLLLDTSGSMGNYNSISWANVTQFARRFALRRNGEDSIGVDTFGENDQTLVGFTTDSQLVVAHIDTFKGSGRGRTMLGRAIAQILAHRENGLRFGDAIVLVSDGDRSLSDKTDFARLRDELIRAGIRICLIRVPSLGTGGLKQVDVSDASPFVIETGGIELNMVGGVLSGQGDWRLDPHTLESTVEAAYAFIRTFYRVGLEISKPITKSKPLYLEVVDRQKRKIKGAQLNYPQYLSEY